MQKELVTYFNNYEGLVRWFYRTYGNMASYIDEGDIRSLVQEGIWRGYVASDSENTDDCIAKTVKNCLRNFILYHSRMKRASYKEIVVDSNVLTSHPTYINENYILLNADIERFLNNVPRLRRNIAMDWLYHDCTINEIAEKHNVWVSTVYYHIGMVKRFLAPKIEAYAQN